MNSNSDFNSNAARQAKLRNLGRGTGSLLIIIAVVVIALVLNIFINMLNINYDMTPNELYTLSKENIAFLDGVRDVQVEIYGLFDVNKLPGSDYDLIMQLLDDYATHYDNITVQYVDPDKNPEFMVKLDPAGTLDYSSGDFIVVNATGITGDYYSAKKKVVKSSSLFNLSDDMSFNYSMKAENAISGAINYVASGNTPVIYSLVGHGEDNFLTGYSLVAEQLDYSNYSVVNLDLVSQPRVPDNTSAILMVNPKQDISADEKIKLSEYLKTNRGSLILILSAIQAGTEFPNLQSILDAYNIGINNDLVAEASRYVVSDAGNSYVFRVTPARDDTILTNSSISEYQLIMGFGRSFRFLSNYNESLTKYTMISTSSASISTPLKEGQNGSQGSAIMGAAVENARGSKVVVFGSGTFISDSIYSGYVANWLAGSIVFKNVVEWIAPVENSLNIQAKIIHTDYNLSVSNDDVMLIGILCIIVLPLAVAGIGIFVWLRRRHL